MTIKKAYIIFAVLGILEFILIFFSGVNFITATSIVIIFNLALGTLFLIEAMWNISQPN